MKQPRIIHFGPESQAMTLEEIARMSEFAIPFEDMAARIALNSEQPFGGAFVIVPPDGEAEHMLLLDAGKNPAVFWSMVQTRAMIVLKELEDAERQGGMMGRR